jgi:hypothetical protein
MRLKLLVLAVAAFLVLSTAAASAFQWYVSYGQAKNATKEFSKAFCEADRECVAWGVGSCQRRSSSRFDCVMGSFYEDPEAGEIECDMVLHWGVRRSGYLALKRHGPPHCFPR